MAQSNTERVGRALELLREGLKPFFERTLEAAYGAQWRYTVADAMRNDRDSDGLDELQDVKLLLTVMWFQWNAVFGKTLGPAERNYVGELRDTRNRWAHQEAFSTDDAYRALDTIERLLQAVSAPEAIQVGQHKQELLRVRFEESARKELRRAITRPLESQATTGLRPWREIVTPHPDVSSGRYQQAEFAADLGQVARGEGSEEYRDPHAFFERTFLTEGLRGLLTNALRRLSGNGGDPVVELQTNFGGGKTHSMLALYHLCSGVAAGELAGVEPVLAAAGVTQLFAVRRAVLSGQAISPGQPSQKPDGALVHTLWGELAWQLGQFDAVREADRNGVSPGSDVLRHILAARAPCLVLIDEWVTHARQLATTIHLPAGSFDANMSFAQALTEAARAVPQTLIVASLPASDTEVGGDAGREALARLKQIFGRVESVWRPASTVEGYEIVRRRLFRPITDPDLFRQRDAVIQGFSQFYQEQKDEFPGECREAEYQRRLSSAYPFHPELFDRLYKDWCDLDRFQQTRGVLRLMAAVIAALWERSDPSLLIMPASIPIDTPTVQEELMHYLDLPWRNVVEADVIELPLALDRESTNLGRVSATRRVARALFMGSAPVENRRLRGLNDKQIKLGAAQPGESVGTFGDALRRLSDRATYVYANDERYWYSTQPSVTRLAQDRAAQLDATTVHDEIRRRLKQEAAQRGDLSRVQSCPESSADVPDERDARLIILDPRYPHVAHNSDSPAMRAAQAMQASRGSSTRLYRNSLVYLAPDNAQLEKLAAAVRLFLAWESIRSDAATLNLDTYQTKQAEAKTREAAETVAGRIPETYFWLIAPTQEISGAIELPEHRLAGGKDALVPRAARQLVKDGLLTKEMAGSVLRLDLDRVPLWREQRVRVKDLLTYYATYLYLPRLRDPQVLIDAIAAGLKPSLVWEQDGFAYADGWDAAQERFRGLRLPGEDGTINPDGDAVLVHPAAALAQRAREAEARQAQQAQTPETYPPADLAQSRHAIADEPQAFSVPAVPATPSSPPPHPPPAPVAARPRRFHGTIRLQPLRMGRDAGDIAQEIVAHLAALPGATVEVTLEIHAVLPDGAPEQIVRTVSENAQTLHFHPGEYDFETE